MKHKRRNRMISAAIAAVLCLFLAGCGRGSGTVPQTDTSGKIEVDGSGSEEKLQGTSEDVSMDVSIEVSEESASQGMEAEIPDFYEAVHAAAQQAKPGDIVLLSPASAAFDRFKNFMVRGAEFKKTVMAL